MTDTQPKTVDRRNFLGKVAAVSTAAVVGAGLLAPAVSWAVSPALKFSDIPGTGDFKVLNYALALEALESDLYVQAYQRLTTGGTNALGKRINGLGINNNSPDVAYLRQFGKVEFEHRNFLDTALGSESLLRKAPFNNAKFDFKMETLTRRQVVDLVYLAEKTGVGAYLGAIPFFATRTYLQTAGAIQGTEARHTAIFAAVLNQLFRAGLNTAPLANENNGIDAAIPPNTVLASISPFIVL